MLFLQGPDLPRIEGNTPNAEGQLIGVRFHLQGQDYDKAGPSVTVTLQSTLAAQEPVAILFPFAELRLSECRMKPSCYFAPLRMARCLSKIQKPWRNSNAKQHGRSPEFSRKPTMTECWQQSAGR